jgi:hypothetical protein
VGIRDPALREEILKFVEALSTLPGQETCGTPDVARRRAPVAARVA